MKMRGSIDSVAARCRACRVKGRERKEEARRVRAFSVLNTASEIMPHILRRTSLSTSQNAALYVSHKENISREGAKKEQTPSPRERVAEGREGGFFFAPSRLRAFA
jgi:hypothetical protein